MLILNQTSLSFDPGRAVTGGSEPQARMTRPQDPDHGKWCGAWGGGRGAALQVPDLPAPRLQLLCCTCDLGAKRKRLFLRSVLQTWALRMVCSRTLLRAATRGRCPPVCGPVAWSPGPFVKACEPCVHTAHSGHSGITSEGVCPGSPVGSAWGGAPPCWELLGWGRGAQSPLVPELEL